MDYVREFLTRVKTGSNDKDDCDENVLNGPTIGISPGQVKEDVHYMESRGAIDLSHLRFHADDNPTRTHAFFDFDVQSNNKNDDNDNKGNGSVGTIESFVDIAVFEVPKHCTSRNCDLSKFGVGSLIHVNSASYLSLCQAGRLQLDHNIFKGHHTQLMIPSEGPMPDRITQHKYSKFSMPKERNYEVLLANCHEKGRHIHVVGQVVFDLVNTDTVVNNLTAGSMTILVSVAFMVFAFLTIVVIRINWGTRADFEQEQDYGLVPDNDGDEEESPTDLHFGTLNEEENDRIEDGEANPEVEERGNLSRVTQATII